MTSLSMDQTCDPIAKQNEHGLLTNAVRTLRLLRDNNTGLCQIDEGLYLGSIGDANNKAALKAANITHVLTMAKLKPPFPNDFVYKVIEVIDSQFTNIAQHFDECFSFIEEAKRQGGGVLVHCFMGISRSVTIVVAYLMTTHSMKLSEAMEHVRSRRPQAAPNPGFFTQLTKYEDSLKATRTSFSYAATQGTE